MNRTCYDFKEKDVINSIVKIYDSPPAFTTFFLTVTSSVQLGLKTGVGGGRLSGCMGGKKENPIITTDH